MADELIEELRLESQNMHYGKDDCVLFTKAADTIEELQKAVYFHKYNSEFWEDKYNSLADEKWIPVEDHLPEEFVSVQAHMTDAGQFPSVREGYLVGGRWFFPALDEFHPVDRWRAFDEPEMEDTHAES